jgi:hypothetical protein
MQNQREMCGFYGLQDRDSGSSESQGYYPGVRIHGRISTHHMCYGRA